MASEVVLPKLGMNMESATIVRWYRDEGDTVSVGDVLADVETDKTTTELESESAGVLRKRLADEGEKVSVHQAIAIIGSADEDISRLLAQAAAPQPIAAPSHVERVYQSWKGTSTGTAGGAMAIADDRNGQVTENAEARRLDPAALRARLAQRGVLPSAGQASAPARTRIVIYGAGLGAKQLLEVTRQLDDVQVLGLIDDGVDMAGASMMGTSVLGGFAVLTELAHRGQVDGVALSFHSEVRRKVHRRIRSEIPGLTLHSLIDPRAMVGMDVQVGEGALIEAGAVVGPGTVVGEGVIVDVGAIVAHDCHLGPFSHLSPGCALSGVVNLTENVLVGVGAAINSTVTIGRNVIISAGAAVMNDVPDDAVVMGVPAKVIGKSRRGA